MKLYTGGKEHSKKKSLFKITANAQKYGQPSLAYGDYPWWDTPSTPVEPNKINVLGWWLFGSHLEGSGYLFRTLPDNAEMNLNLRVPGVKHYNASSSVAKVSLDLKSVTFTGTAGTILKDDGSGTYAAPEYEQDIDGNALQKNPALYVSGAKVKTATQFFTTGGGFDVVVKGEVSAGSTSFTLWATNTPGEPISTFSTSPDKALKSSRVDFYDPMTIK